MKEYLEELVTRLIRLFKNREELKQMTNKTKRFNYSKKNQKSKIVSSKTKKKEPEMTEEQKQEIRDSLTKQLVAREYAPVSHDTLSKSITYVTAGNGLFKVRKTPIAIFKEQIAEIKDENMGLPDMEEGVELAIPKLPFRYLIESLSFYRDVNELDKTEASILYFYNHRNVELPDVEGIREENQVITYVPVQENSKTLSNFKDDENVHWLRENTALLLESHSHNTMSAFFSGTDDANENNNQFYTVWGKVEDGEPEIAFRYVVGDSKVDVSPTVLFDWPILEEVTTTHKTIETMIHGESELVDMKTEKEMLEIEPEITKEFVYVEGPFNHVEYPEEWLDQHSKSVPTHSYNARKAAHTSGYPSHTNVYDYSGYYQQGGAEQLTFDYEDDAFGAEQTFRTTADELANLRVFSDSSYFDLASPNLEEGIYEMLHDIRANYSSTYEELKG